MVLPFLAVGLNRLPQLSPLNLFSSLCVMTPLTILAKVVSRNKLCWMNSMVWSYSSQRRNLNINPRPQVSSPREPCGAGGGGPFSTRRVPSVGGAGRQVAVLLGRLRSGGSASLGRRGAGWPGCGGAATRKLAAALSRPGSGPFGPHLGLGGLGTGFPVVSPVSGEAARAMAGPAGPIGAWFAPVVASARLPHVAVEVVSSRMVAVQPRLGPGCLFSFLSVVVA
jgi:hypothetical protein